MTLLKFASHDWSSNLTDHYDASVNGPTIVTSNPRTGTRNLRAASGAGRQGKLNLGGSPATVITGFGFYMSGAPNSNSIIMRLLEAGSAQIGVGITPAGKLYVERNGTTIATMAGAGLTNARYYYIESKFLIHPSAGTYEVRVDGVNVLSGTGANTRATSNSYCDQLAIGSAADPGVTFDYDDVVVMDTNGSTMNDFQGDMALVNIYPTGTGNAANWTPSSAVANWTTVDEEPSNTSDYNAAASVLTDTYAFGNLPGTAATVKFVAAVITDTKTDGGPATVAPVARPASTDRLGADHTPSTTLYTPNKHIWEVSPETSSAWTVSEVNGSEFGIKRTA